MALPLAAKLGRDAQMLPVTGVCRKGKRTKELVKRLRAGDIAVIDHADLDSVAATSLADRKIAAVIDAAPPISGKYPNRGPMVLADAGIPLYQLEDPTLFDALIEGRELTIDVMGRIVQMPLLREHAVSAWPRAEIAARMEVARANIGRELEEFAANTLSYVRVEKAILIEPVAVPPLRGTRSLAKKHVVIVVRGEGYREDFNSIRSYLRDLRPILIGVDGGADAIREFGFTPDIILGDMDSVSDETLRCGAKVVVHAYADGNAPGLARVEALGIVGAETFPVSGTSEDAAMLLAHEKGAELIVAVGTHSNLEDFLDKGRAGMASTFLVRLKVGSRLVDARGVSQLHRRSASGPEILALLLAGGAAVYAVVSSSVIGQSIIGFVHNWIRLRFH